MNRAKIIPFYLVDWYFSSTLVFFKISIIEFFGCSKKQKLTLYSNKNVCF
jgi:hypothetical protein